MTLICVPMMVEDEASALRDSRLAAEFGADLVEFRIDSIFTGAAGADGEREVAAVLRLVRESAVPCIVTCRPASGGEGGHYDGPEDARVSLFERLGAAAVTEKEHPPRYIDVELAAYTRSANFKQKVNLAVQHPAQVRDLKTSLILSSHDFQGRPADLLRRLATMREQAAASVLKIAYRARSLRDNLELFDLMRESDRPMIALGMGEFGLMSRVLAPKFGGFVTFASLRPTSTTAPGQPTVHELLDRYRFRSIKANTRVYGVIGYPVSHSISPDVHNAGFEAIGEWAEHDDDGNEIAGTRAGGVYLPMPVPAEYEHFKATVNAMIDHEALRFCGASVTIPHKEHLVRLAREHLAAGDGKSRDGEGRQWDIDRVSLMCGAANTLVVRRDAHGVVQAFDVVNSDAMAGAMALMGAMGMLPGRSVAVLGAGGAARAVACGVALMGANVTLHNRSLERAKAVADELNRAIGASGRGDGDIAGVVDAAELRSIGERDLDAIVNATPVGMKGGPEPAGSPVSAEAMRSLVHRNGARRVVVMDTVYNPVETPLLKIGRDAQAETIDGLAMFVRQAEMQFVYWTEQEAAQGLFGSVAWEIMSRG